MRVNRNRYRIKPIAIVICLKSGAARSANSQSEIVEITVDEILRKHESLIVRYGGDSSNRSDDTNCVERSLAAAKQACYYANEGRSDAAHVASNLLFYLAKNHCFTDGNKRIAWAAAVEVLLRSGLQIAATEIEAADFVLSVANDTRNREQVLEWFASDGRLEAYQS